MSQIQTMFKNLSWLMVSQIISSVCAFVWTILTARYLGVSDYGIMGFAISFTGIIGITMDFGISTHIIRHISTDYDSAPKYLGNAIPIKSIFSIGTFVLALIILIVMGCDELTIQITLLFTIERIFMSMTSLFNGSFQAFEKNKYSAIGTIIFNITLLIFILISIFANYGLYGISISYVLANFVILIYLYYSLRKHIVIPSFELDWSFCKKITLLSIPFALTSFFYLIYYSIDMIMVTNMVGNYANGIYNASYKLISVLTVFSSIYTAIFFPVMSKFFKNEKNLLKVSFEKSVKYLMMIMIPLAFATVLYSTDIVQLIYGHEYDPAHTVLSILIWTVCLLFINSACTNLLNASHKEKSVTIVYMIAALFNVVLNMYMIPNYSYDGAAVSTVLSDLLILILFLIMIARGSQLPDKKLVFDLIKIIIGSVVLYGILSFLGISMWLAIPLGIIIYLICLFVFRTFDKEDIFIIKEVLGKN